MKTEKNIAVLDTSVVVAGIFWKSDAYRCLVALTKRRFSIAAGTEIFAEYRRVALRKQKEHGIDPGPILAFLELTADLVEPIPFTRRLSRDSGDNMFIGTALAARASFVVTYDPDLLVLEKPFGVEMIRPREFLRKISQ